MADEQSAGAGSNEPVATQQQGAPQDGAQQGAPQGTAQEGASQPQAGEPVYEFEMPEGIDLDKEAADQFVALAKEAKLPPDVAKKIVDLEVGRLQRAIEAHTKTVESWVEAVKADKEIGGEKFDQNIAAVRRVVDSFGDADLKAVLNQTGLGSHPALVKFAWRISKALSEDSFGTQAGGVKSSGPVTDEDIAKSLFPTMK